MTTPETFTLARPDGVELHGLCWRPQVADAAASCTVVPDPLAMRILRLAWSSSGLARSLGVIDVIIASMRSRIFCPEGSASSAGSANS